jgi:Pup-like protein
MSQLLKEKPSKKNDEDEPEVEVKDLHSDIDIDALLDEIDGVLEERGGE